MEDKIRLAVSAAFIAIAVVGSLSIWIVGSYFEANAFNEVTGRSVTTWQAMWVELRVSD